MLNWIKSLFKKSSAPTTTATTKRLKPSQKPQPLSRVPSIPQPPPPPPKRVCHTRSKSERRHTDDEDFATSLVVGMATNNAVLGAVVGGSLAGGIVGDLVNDGCLGSCSTESTGSSYDSGSCGD